jgi:transcription antitermination factor NusG
MQKLSKNWYIVYTRAKNEKKVAEQLAKRKIEHYCPLNHSQREWGDRRRNSMEPLFPSYIFVYLDEIEQSKVGPTDGMLSFVYWQGKPAVVSNEEVYHIRQLLNDFSEVRIEKTAVSLYEKVKVLSSPVMVREGNVLEVRNTSVKITLPSLGYTLVADIKRENAESMSRLSTSRLYAKIKNSLIP